MPPTSLDAAVARYERPLVRYATRIVGDPELARDVVQDTFVRLWEAEDVDPSDARIESWLYTVCRNRAIDERRKRRPMELLDESTASVEPRGEQARALAEVHDVVETLPERKGKVFALRYGEGRSYQQISDETGLSVSHVGVILHDTVRRLRKQLAVAVVLIVVVAGAWLWPRPEPMVLAPQLKEQHLTVPVMKLLPAPVPAPEPTPEPTLEPEPEPPPPRRVPPRVYPRPMMPSTL